jgi:DNA invertase Pin-like site-specific DNA recombinase
MAYLKLRTAIYARVSTLDQDPAMQLRAYAAPRRLPITAEFIDQVSGTTADRPALARLWQAVRARKVDAILRRGVGQWSSVSSLSTMPRSLCGSASRP